jgi:hypothetical protein
MTTPARPDIEADVSELSLFRRSAIRLHPRAGEPGALDSSLGGPAWWNAADEWPTCTAAHGSDVDLTGLVDRTGLPEPMVLGLQLWRRDVTDLPFEESEDLCQVFWCPLFHGLDWEPLVLVRWSSVGDPDSGWSPVTSIPSPFVNPEFVPRPCTVAPETVVEHAGSYDLPEDVGSRAEAWARGVDLDYDRHLSAAPGTKVGGWPGWSQYPNVPLCADDHTMQLLLTVESREYDDESFRTWIPVGERPFDGQSDGGLSFGDVGTLFIFVCTVCPGRVIRSVMEG